MSGPRRHVQAPTLACSPRSMLDPTTHPALDTILKGLKSCSRRLQVALSAHRSELQVLERLYYKGKNQHRTALFWQRVAEMRKFGERIDGMSIDTVVEDLRLSFWGDASGRTKKQLKGSWTHVPDAKTLVFTLERCHSCHTLINNAKRRLVDTYSSLGLVLQTGAFLPVILTFIAIASRFGVLLDDALDALADSWSANYKALQVLFPRESEKAKILHVSSQSDLDRSRIPPPFGEQSISNTTGLEGADEDLGSVILHATSGSNPASFSALEGEKPVRKESLETVAGSILSDGLGLSNDLFPENAGASISTTTIVATTCRKRTKDEVDSIKKKKKKKRDEIDDIFGF